MSLSSSAPFVTCCESSECNRTHRLVKFSMGHCHVFLVGSQTLVLEQSEQMPWPLILVVFALLLSMWGDGHCPSEFQLSHLRGLRPLCLH